MDFFYCLLMWSASVLGSLWGEHLQSEDTFKRFQPRKFWVLSQIWDSVTILSLLCLICLMIFLVLLEHDGIFVSQNYWHYRSLGDAVYSSCSLPCFMLLPKLSSLPITEDRILVWKEFLFGWEHYIPAVLLTVNLHVLDDFLVHFLHICLVFGHKFLVTIIYSGLSGKCFVQQITDTTISA